MFCFQLVQHLFDKLFLNTREFKLLSSQLLFITLALVVFLWRVAKIFLGGPKDLSMPVSARESLIKILSHFQISHRIQK